MSAWRRDRLGLALLLCACPTDGFEDPGGSIRSASGRWRFGADTLITDVCEVVGTADGSPPDLLIAGTRWCPELSCVDIDACDIHDLACHDLTIDGPATCSENRRDREPPTLAVTSPAPRSLRRRTCPPRQAVTSTPMSRRRRAPRCSRSSPAPS